MTYANDMPILEKHVRSTAGLATELRFSVMRLRRRLVKERHPDNDLSLTAMAVLWVLHGRGDQTVGALAAREQVRPPTMTRTVTALAERGLVERHDHPEDGRQVVVRVTDAGRQIVQADAARRDRWLALRLDELTPDERDVLRRAAPILQRLAESDQTL